MGDTAIDQITGTLESGWMGIGGEHTGWVLIAEADESPTEVEVSRIRSSAQALNGQRVTITGQMVEKRYVERGVVRVLLAEQIAPVEP